MNPLQQLHNLGQSVWLDDLCRTYLEDGTLANLIRNDGLCGITSNPAILERAIGQSNVYDEAIKQYAEAGDNTNIIYERLVIEDIQRAADILRPIYDATNTGDGYVSLEVSPHLADDTESSITEGLRLWSAVGRPNLMIKVPGTRAGLPAVEALIAEGVNVTLLFSPLRYREVVNAYWSGLEKRIEMGQSPQGIASVASFFLSRIDTLVDGIIDRRGAGAAVRGNAALTAATLAYRYNLDLHKHERWLALQKAGARSQRLLWASTSTKDLQYSDVKYVEALVAADTINTMPMATLHAYRDHGKPKLRLQNALAQVDEWQNELNELRIDLSRVAEQLEQEGIKKFIDPYDSLMNQIDSKRQSFLA